MESSVGALCMIRIYFCAVFEARDGLPLASIGSQAEYMPFLSSLHHRSIVNDFVVVCDVAADYDPSIIETLYSLTSRRQQFLLY